MSGPFHAKVVRYYHKETGKRCGKGEVGAEPRQEETTTYYARVGGQKVSLGTDDLGQAWETLRALLRRHKEGKSGLVDSYTDAAEVPLVDHLAAYRAVLVAKGCSPRHIAAVMANSGMVVQAAGWKRLADVTEDSCLVALAKLVSERGVGPRTRNFYLAHTKQFCRWACRSKRLRENPLEGLDPVSVDTDLRHLRRCPTEEEIGLLMAYLHGPTARVRRGMTGPQRALGYRVCMATGLRAGELRSLGRANFDLTAGTVKCVGAYSKNKRTDVLPLPPWLVEELTAWFAGGGGCWSTLPEFSPGPAVLQPDLEASGVAWSVPSPEGPLFFDFHSLRVFFLTWAGNHPGISPKTLQALARHSSPALTLKIYSKIKTADVSALVDGMPQPGGNQGQPKRKKG